MDRNYEVITISQNSFSLSRPDIVNFADIIKIAIMFIKKIV